MAGLGEKFDDKGDTSSQPKTNQANEQESNWFWKCFHRLNRLYHKFTKGAALRKVINITQTD